jgi:catechol 2,3-dioxygenase-like lactoylglutathione lyase family enzyme
MRLRVKHIGMVCRSEADSDKFYGSLLGLKKIGVKIVPAGLVHEIFNRKGELKIVNYADENTHFEVFIDPLAAYDDTKIEHVCIEVKDLNAFIAACEERAVTYFQVSKPGGRLTFARDADGNLFEIKEKPATSE